jgi:hypothetical protein
VASNSGILPNSAIKHSDAESARSRWVDPSILIRTLERAVRRQPLRCVVIQSASKPYFRFSVLAPSWRVVEVWCLSEGLARYALRSRASTTGAYATANSSGVALPSNTAAMITTRAAEPRLTNAGFAVVQHDAALARPGLREAVTQIV